MTLIPFVRGHFMPHRARLLGFAFTNADFLFEMDTDGTILFAAGAANDLVKESGETLVGRNAGKLFKPAEGTKFSTFAKALKSGDRAGPIKLTLATGIDANLAMFRLPENGANISCTLARPDRGSLPSQTDAKTGLPSRDGFLAAAQKAGEKDTLTLVNVPGLPELCARLSPDSADAMMQRIGTSLATSGASAAGRISDTSFGTLSPATRGSLGLGRAISDAIAAGGLAAPAIAEAQIGLRGPGLSEEQRLLSLRYVIDRFAEKAKIDTGDGDIASIFAGMMDETQLRLADMTRVVGEGAFEIAYQPISDLATGKVSHYEALARFTNPEGTGETVKFIEALGIANAFDLAVANKVLGLIEQTDAHIAFNVSGVTIASPASFGLLAGLLARRRKLAARTLIEITETAAIIDLESAGKAIAAIRAMGYRVGLDDFGAGAASVNYLHAFPVDFVKFDGALINKIGSSKRDDALLAGLAKLCDELGVTTIAEWIESEAMAKAARGLGFHHGQGRWLGAPTLEIPATATAPGKRQGVRESWG
ncbi:MAG TPA: EAL domain-containing protein [Rhizomicrobium sp.]|jgi:EAL domain-containing protein (putative c-di-GMP-specific phosphodiesterase class I)|nr:EAL domain-containing protein [Rhizomicrobium sp.]